MSSSPISGHILRINRLLTAVGSGKVVCVEKDALIALDLNTGRQLWQTPPAPLGPRPPSLRENLLNFSTIVIHEDVVLFLQPTSRTSFRKGLDDGACMYAVGSFGRHRQGALGPALQSMGAGFGRGCLRDRRPRVDACPRRRRRRLRRCRNRSA